MPLVENPLACAHLNRVLPVRTPDTVVDFVLATIPFEIEAISRAVRTKIGNVEARVCTAQDLIIHKIVSERPRDHEDVVGVLKRSRGYLALKELDAVLEGLARDLERPAIAQRYRSAKESAGID